MKKVYALLLTFSTLFAWATNHQVTVGSNFYNPQSLTIMVGDTVTWTNTGGNHNVNGSTTTFPGNPASFGNGAASTSAWTYSYTFTVAGTYNYQCDPHAPAMSGTVTVNAAAVPCSDLFFSEYIEGSSNNKGFEIYNPTGNAINLSSYTVYLSVNGGSSTSTLALFGTLASGDVFMVTTNQADTTIQNQADTALAFPSVAHFNGDDALILVHNTDTIDVIGVPGVDPGTNWPVGTGATSEYTLVRKPTVEMGSTNWTTGATEWDVYPQNTYSYFGAHTSNCIIIPGAPCTDLFFSEYIEGSSNNKGFEIYNPSNATINLSNYTVYLSVNGGSNTSTLTLFGTLAPGDVFMVTTNQADTAIQNQADTALAFPSVAHFNGDDALILVNNTDTIDVVGVPGVDPGTNWPVGSGATSEYTLVRKVTVQSGSTDWAVGATQWDVYPQNTYTYFGSHASVCQGAVVPPSVYEIADIVTVDANGVADSLNVTCTIRGLVSGNNLRVGGVEFWLIDTVNTAGLLVRNTGYNNYTVTEGDKLLVTGTVSQFNGLIQFVPDTIVVLSSGNTLPAPASTTTLDESTEGRLNIMYNMTIVSGWQSTSGSANVTVSDGSNTFTMRVDFDTYIFDSIPNAPTGLVNIIGHGGQFDGSSPYTSGYQINPRYAADIQPVTATSPTINFPGPSQTVTEGAGTVDIIMPIFPTSTASETVKIYVSEGSGITSGDYTTTPAAVNDTITLTVAAGDSAMFSVNLIDDAILESDEDITFSIASVSSGLTVGPVAQHVFTISDNDLFIPTYSISDLKGLDANFVPDSSGVMCKVVGTVLGVDMQGTASANVSFTIHNGTVGFGVFMPNSTYTVTEGDQVRVIGTVGHFNGLAQINADSIAFISANNPLPTPNVITSMGENTESDLIRFNNCFVIDPTQWTNSGSGFNVDVTNGTDTIVLRIDKDVVDVFAAPAPIGTFDVIGIGGQFDASAPHNSGYQFLPRYLADFIFPTPLTYDLAITEIMPGSNDPDPNVNDDWFEITNYGSTAVDMTGFSYDDDSEQPGTVVFGNVTIGPGESIVVWNGVSANELAFETNWGVAGQNLQIISSDEVTGTTPGLGQGGDAVVLYDTSGTPIEICKAVYQSANAGFSVEFDTTCSFIGNAQVGVRGAYASIGGDVGSPGNLVPSFGIEELSALGINAYPNPTSGLVTLTLPVGEKEIKLVNVTGVTVLANQTEANTITLNLEDLPAGMYMLHINVNGKQAMGKLIKQ